MTGAGGLYWWQRKWYAWRWRHRSGSLKLHLSAEDYDRLLAELDEPPKVLPGLKRLLEEHPEWRD